MQTLSLIWGILAILGMVVGFIPCLGALNWLNIPFSGIGLIISVISLATSDERTRGAAIGGVICCAIAVMFGIIRLIIGGGVL
ncbi:MAG: hypothetical protein ACOY90_10140 [Candidatus Zhuqueibacterota bacterium]